MIRIAVESVLAVAGFAEGIGAGEKNTAANVHQGQLSGLLLTVF